MTDDFLQLAGASESAQAVALDSAELQHALKAANRMADAAGAAILPHFRKLKSVENKLANGAENTQDGSGTAYDPVTVADREAEAAIRRVIKAERPQDGIYGEEYGFEKGDSGLTWVLDPIDGTRGFVCGLPTWGTLVGLYNGQRSVLGLMDQPVLKERFTGIVGETKTASLVTPSGEQAIGCRSGTSLDESLLCITAPEVYAGDKQEAYRKITKAVASTRYGTDCYGYAMLACGFVDLVVEPGLQPYDIQALVPIVEAAGGVITDWAGNPVASGGDVIAAANEALHQQVLSLLN